MISSSTVQLSSPGSILAHSTSQEQAINVPYQNKIASIQGPTCTGKLKTAVIAVELKGKRSIVLIATQANPAADEALYQIWE